MKTRDLRRVFIYHSPQYPGYTCWCGLWNMPDHSVICSFTQATGPFQGRPSAPDSVRHTLAWPPQGHGDEYDMTGLRLQNVHLRSADAGETWTWAGSDDFRSCMNGTTGEAEEALPDGTILRGVWGRYLPYDDVPRDGYMERSTDRGRTWSDLPLDDGLAILRKEPSTPYYPKSVQLPGGEILIVGHVGGDNGYGIVDQSIVGVRFFLEEDSAG